MTSDIMKAVPFQCCKEYMVKDGRTIMLLESGKLLHIHIIIDSLYLLY
jgi:hypothetical protein